MEDDDDYGDAHDADLAAALEAAEKASSAANPPAPVPTAPPAPATATATATAKPAVQQPTPQKLRSAGSSIIVNGRQKGNPILNYIKNVPWEYGDIVPDYIVGASACALFLSLKYHRLHPEYLYTRLKPLTNLYTLRLLLVLVDIDTHADPLRELTRTCLLNDLTLLLSWSAPEAGRYLETYKMYEHASAASIMERPSSDPGTRVVEVLTQVRSVNRTDAVALVSNFGSVRAAVNAPADEVLMVQGWGQRKVERWDKAVTAPFRGRGGAAGAARRTARGRGGGAARGAQVKLGIGAPAEVESGGREEWAVEEDEEALMAVAEMEAEERRRERDRDREKGKGKEVDRGTEESAPDESVASGILDALTKLRERG